MKLTDERLRDIANPYSAYPDEAKTLVSELLLTQAVVEAVRKFERSTTLGAERQARDEMFAALAAYDASRQKSS